MYLPASLRRRHTPAGHLLAQCIVLGVASAIAARFLDIEETGVLSVYSVTSGMRVHIGQEVKYPNWHLLSESGARR